MGHGVHQALFSKVMNAPINLFFDVTPVGKVFSRFSRDIGVFDGAMFHGFRNIFGQVTYLMMLFYFLLGISSYMVVYFLLLTIICYQVVKPYLAIDNQLHRVGHCTFSPMESYMDQALAGNKTIRAFNNVQ